VAICPGLLSYKSGQLIIFIQYTVHYFELHKKVKKSNKDVKFKTVQKLYAMVKISKASNRKRRYQPQMTLATICTISGTHNVDIGHNLILIGLGVGVGVQGLIY